MNSQKLYTVKMLYVVIAGQITFDVAETTRGRFMCLMADAMYECGHVANLSQWTKEMFDNEQIAKKVFKLLKSPEVEYTFTYGLSFVTDDERKKISFNKPYNIGKIIA